jgi:hypothetical protein
MSEELQRQLRKVINDIPVVIREGALLIMAEIVLEEIPKAHEEHKKFKAELVDRLIEVISNREE